MKALLNATLVLGLVAGSVQAGTILIVSDDQWKNSRAPGGANEPPAGALPEDDLVAFLQGLGHTVHRSTPKQYREGNEGSAGVQAFMDGIADPNKMVIVSRVTDSGQYDEGNNGVGWNAIDVPLLLMGPHLARSSRWKWLSSTSIHDGAVENLAAFPDPNHPFVAGRTTNMTLPVGTGRTLTRVATPNSGNGTVVATIPDGNVAIVEWAQGTEYYGGSGQTAGAWRVLFTGLRYHEDVGTPVVFDDFSANGQAILAQTVNTMIPEPATLALLAAGVVATLIRRKK